MPQCHGLERTLSSTLQITPSNFKQHQKGIRRYCTERFQLNNKIFVRKQSEKNVKIFLLLLTFGIPTLCCLVGILDEFSASEICSESGKHAAGIRNRHMSGESESFSLEFPVRKTEQVTETGSAVSGNEQNQRYMQVSTLREFALNTLSLLS